MLACPHVRSFAALLAAATVMLAVAGSADAAFRRPAGPAPAPTAPFHGGRGGGTVVPAMSTAVQYHPWPKKPSCSPTSCSCHLVCHTDDLGKQVCVYNCAERR